MGASPDQKCIDIFIKVIARGLVASDSPQVLLKLLKFIFGSYDVLSGLSTSFFNDKNKNIIRDLMDLLVEAHQEVPAWLEGMACDVRHQQSNRRGNNRK